MSPFTIDESLQIALDHHRAGRWSIAEAIYRQVLEQAPNHTGALNSLGALASEQDRHDTAIELFRRAIAVRPDVAEFHRNLGVALRELGHLDDAVASLQRALTLDDDDPESLLDLGEALVAKGLMDDAIVCFDRALRLKPESAGAHFDLGVAANFKGWTDQATAYFLKALELRPNYAEALTNLGNIYHDTGRVDEALAVHRRAVALKPESPFTHLNYGLALLAKGEFKLGWAEYEWRQRFTPPGRNFAQPQWDGRPLAGRTILLHAEQGYGDTLHFIRYLPFVAQAGGRIVAEYQRDLGRLLRDVVAKHTWIPRGEPLPPFDVHCPFMSLPRIFGANFETIPRQIPYIRADAAASETWRQRLAGDSGFLKVGLAWAGNKNHKKDRVRSIPTSMLAPLFQVSGTRFYSLQKRDEDQPASDIPSDMPLTNWTDELLDFADTAAFVDNLDLVISADTAVAHLAGAMGKSTWTLLPFSPDWRWLLDRSDSPWYPTMRLFRQPAPGDWNSVAFKVADALQGFKSVREER